MKTSHKFIVLVVISCLCSIIIFNHVEKANSVDIISDLAQQSYNYEQELNLIEDYKYSINEPRVILNPYGISPLTALIVFETKDLTAVTVTVKGKNQYTTYKDTFVPDKIHYIPVYGLYPDHNNEVILTVGNENYVINIQTEKIEIDLPTANISKPSLIKDTDLIFAASNTSHHAFAYDANGDIRWYLTETLGTSLTRLNNGHILVSNGSKTNPPYYYTGLLEMNLLGKIFFEYIIPEGFHQGVYEMPSGDLLVATNNFKTNTVEDHIIELNRSDGRVVRNWNLYDILNPTINDYDWFKIDKLSYDIKTNSIKVSNAKNTVINIDYNTGEINYINGNKDLFSESIHRFVTETKESTNKIIALEQENHILVQKYSNNKTIITEKLNNLDIFEILIDDNLSEVSKMSLYANEIFTLGQFKRFGEPLETKVHGSGFTFLKKSITDEMIEEYDLKLEQNHNRLSVTGTFHKDDQVSIILDNVFKNLRYDINVSEKPYLDNYKNGSKNITVTKFINNTNLKGKYYIFIRINNNTYNLNQYVMFY